jgi:hypothetical protein
LNVNTLGGGRSCLGRLPSLNLLSDETADPRADRHSVLTSETLDSRDHVLRKPNRHHPAHDRSLTTPGGAGGDQVPGIRVKVLSHLSLQLVGHGFYHRSRRYRRSSTGGA